MEMFKILIKEWKCIENKGKEKWKTGGDQFVRTFGIKLNVVLSALNIS